MLLWNILESDVSRERNSEDVNMEEDIHPGTIPQEGTMPDCVQDCIYYICCYGLNGG